VGTRAPAGDPLPERPPRAEWVVRKEDAESGATSIACSEGLGSLRLGVLGDAEPLHRAGHGRVVPGLPDKGSVSTAPGEAGPESVLPYNLPYKSRQLPSSDVVARLRHPCSDRFTQSGAVQKNPSGRIISSFQGNKLEDPKR